MIRLLLLLVLLPLAACQTNPQLSAEQIAAAAKDGRFVCVSGVTTAGNIKVVVAGGDPNGNTISVSTADGCDKVTVQAVGPAPKP